MLGASQYRAKLRYLEAKRRATERANAREIPEREQHEKRLDRSRLATKMAVEKATRDLTRSVMDSLQRSVELSVC